MINLIFDRNEHSYFKPQNCLSHTPAPLLNSSTWLYMCVTSEIKLDCGPPYCAYGIHFVFEFFSGGFSETFIVTQSSSLMCEFVNCSFYTIASAVGRADCTRSGGSSACRIGYDGTQLRKNIRISELEIIRISDPAPRVDTGERCRQYSPPAVAVDLHRRTGATTLGPDKFFVGPELRLYSCYLSKFHFLMVSPQ